MCVFVCDTRVPYGKCVMRGEINRVEQDAKGTEHFKELDLPYFVGVLVYIRS